MPNLLTIPRELRISIAEYLIMNRDKKSLCLVCKELSIVGTPLLYRHMTVTLETLKEGLESTLSEPQKHHGLAHVRSLCIGSIGVWREFLWQQESSVLCRLLSIIPQDVLTQFTLCTSFAGTHYPPVERLLFQRQRYLTNYQYHPNAQESLSAYSLTHITSVHIHLESEADGLRAASVVHQIAGVTDLLIHCDEWFGGDFEQLEEYHRDFAASFFGTSSATRRFPHLKSLRLKGMYFGLFGNVLAKAVDFKQMERLQFVECEDIEDLLVHLSPLQLSCKSLRIEESFADRQFAGTLYTVTDSFLETIVAPQELFIKTDWSEEFGCMKFTWPTLVPHAPTLRALRVTITGTSFPSGHDGILVERPAFTKFCQSASQLRRLALNSPHIEEYAWMDEMGLLWFLDCLSTIGTLELLELFTSPSCLWRTWTPECKCAQGCKQRPLTDMPEYSDATVNHVFQEAANKVFQILRPKCPKFSALMFRAREDDDDVLDHCFAFVRSAEVDQSGRAIHRAVRVELHVLHEYDFYSGIFEFDDMRTTTNAKEIARRACLSAGGKPW